MTIGRYGHDAGVAYTLQKRREKRKANQKRITSHSRTLKKDFSSDLIQCPRCCGSGYVDWEDIDRLGMTNRWVPGPCQYCYGRGSAPKYLLNIKDIRSAAP